MLGRFGGWNEGSLLRRTLLHVCTFALGSLAITALVSFVAVSVAEGLLPSRGAESGETREAAEATAPSPTKAKGRSKRRAAAAAAEPAADKEEAEAE